VPRAASPPLPTRRSSDLKVLVFFTAGAMLSLLAALFGTTTMAVYAFPLCGFFASVMWSIIISLALNSVSSHHGTFAGILCTGIVGGAVVPPIIGGLAELVGLRIGMTFLFITLGYVRSEERRVGKEFIYLFCSLFFYIFQVKLRF